MIRRGCLIALLGIFGGLGMIGAGADVAARHYATSRVEERIRASVPEAHGVRARILGWPFLKVVVNGHVDDLSAHMDRVVERGLAFTNVEVALHGIRINQTKLVSEGKVSVESIQRGTATASITVADLTSLVRLPVTLPNVRVSVNRATREVLIAAAGVVPVAVPLPGPNLLPCIPSVAFSGDAVVLSCTFTQVPAAFTNG